MFCRRAWQRVGPLARRSFRPPRRDAPVRRMSLGVPGGPNNMAYFILCGGGLTAAVVYAYKTVSGDTERYEDRLASMGTAAKAPSAEATPAEEAAPADEVIAESVLGPMEPVAETAAEPGVETVVEEAAAAVSELAVAEAAAEPAATEEAAPPAAVEVAAEVAVETPAEASAMQSTESVPDLLTAVKVLAGSTVEIAAASVGEKSLVNSVQQIQGDGKGTDSTEEVVKPETLEATTDLVADTAAAVVNEEESKSAETGAVDEVADAEEAIPKETSAPAGAEEEEETASSPEDATTSAQTVDELEDQANPDAAPKEDVVSIEASPEDASPAEDAPIAAEAPPVDDAASAAETSVEEAAAELSGEEAVEAASTKSESTAVVYTTQLAAASTVSELEVLSAAEPESEAPVHEAKHCHSCHSAPPAVEEAAPPADVEEQLIREEAVDTTHEEKDVASLVTKTTEAVMTTFQS